MGLPRLAPRHGGANSNSLPGLLHCHPSRRSFCPGWPGQSRPANDGVLPSSQPAAPAAPAALWCRHVSYRCEVQGTQSHCPLPPFRSSPALGPASAPSCLRLGSRVQGSQEGREGALSPMRARGALCPGHPSKPSHLSVRWCRAGEARSGASAIRTKWKKKNPAPSWPRGAALELTAFSETTAALLPRTRSLALSCGASQSRTRTWPTGLPGGLCRPQAGRPADTADVRPAGVLFANHSARSFCWSQSGRNPSRPS